MPRGSILSRPQRSEGRIEGCGGRAESWLTRTLRYALHCALRQAQDEFRATQDAYLIVI